MSPIISEPGGKSHSKTGSPAPIFVKTACLNRVLPEGRPLFGGPFRRVDIEEVEVRPCGGKGSNQDPEDPEACEREIGKAGLGGAYIYLDGSLLNNNNDNDNGGKVGGSFGVGPGGEESEAGCVIGNVATVWDGEVAGMAEGLGEQRSYLGRFPGGDSGTKSQQDRESEV